MFYFCVIKKVVSLELFCAGIWEVLGIDFVFGFVLD
jgi:hypothetical protein